MNYSSHQNQYPNYPPPSQPYNPPQFQPYYSNHQYQHYPHHQQQYQQPQQQYQQPQQQYSSYYTTPNYPNSYPPPPQQQHPQTHQQWHHQQPLIHPPQNAYHQLPQRTDGVVAVPPLVQLQGQNWYPQPQGFRPVIGGPGTYTGPGQGQGPGVGSGASSRLGPRQSRSRSRAGRSLDKGGRQRKGGGREKLRKPAGIGRCEVCNIDTGSAGILKHHQTGKRHKRNLAKLEANENGSVNDSQNVLKPSGDLEPGTSLKPDNLLGEEETKQKLPENIPLDTLPSENKLETEQKINNAQQAGNQKRGVKRKMLVGGGKKKKASKAKRMAIGPSNPKVVIPLTCDLCNVKCSSRELLRLHLLGKNHKSKLKCTEGHHPIYGQQGLQALYPPNPVTNSLCNLQGAQQVSNDAQVSDPIAGVSVLPQNGNAVPSATGVSLN
ncbi:uncharacterized protein LOC132051911 [Lycium ferocissimum]|uniref:uncharacterized protein LOC132051911 n=1 Tax=Lycium ferocissimum TaxID=112874 RepID=UPI002814A12E|nr:uncharacterized protein LOC132051911 [Lycium ferocissimum]